MKNHHKKENINLLLKHLDNVIRNKVVEINELNFHINNFLMEDMQLLTTTVQFSMDRVANSLLKVMKLRQEIKDIREVQEFLMENQ